MGRLFSGKTAELIGTISLKLLSYSLLAVFIYGGSSIVQELMASKMATNPSFESIASYYALLAMGLLLLPIKLIDYFNRLLFMGLLAVVAILLVGLVISIKWSNLPLFAKQYNDPSAYFALIPVVFTSFGFQVI
ncbi:MAG: aromatic amino acid transport family protein [Candidatus Rhabdochlamydia sp.]